VRPIPSRLSAPVRTKRPVLFRNKLKVQVAGRDQACPVSQGRNKNEHHRIERTGSRPLSHRRLLRWQKLGAAKNSRSSLCSSCCHYAVFQFHMTRRSGNRETRFTFLWKTTLLPQILVKSDENKAYWGLTNKASCQVSGFFPYNIRQLWNSSCSDHSDICYRESRRSNTT
jgi:hypothetical protein